MSISLKIPFIRSIAGIAAAKISLLFGRKRLLTIFGGPASGKKVMFNRQMGLGTLAGRNDLKILKALQKLMHHNVVLKKDAVILNAGAGFGLYELFFSKHLGSHCQQYAFESGSGAQDLLEKNITANNIKNTTIIKKAISGKIGIINFFENPLFGSSLIEEEARHHSKETVAKTVFTTTIDIFCKRYVLSPSFIRLNVCGCANQAINGAMETIERSRPVIFVSPHRTEEKTAIAQLMDMHQYEAFSINEFEWLKVKNEDDPLEDILHGPLLLVPYRLKEEVNYAMFNRYRRDAGAVQKWMPGGNTTDGYAFN